MYFLLPFYIFKQEKNFREFEKNPEKLEELKKEYKNMLDRMDLLAKSIYNEGTLLFGGFFQTVSNNLLFQVFSTDGGCCLMPVYIFDKRMVWLFLDRLLALCTLK